MIAGAGEHHRGRLCCCCSPQRIHQARQSTFHLADGCVCGSWVGSGMGSAAASSTLPQIQLKQKIHTPNDLSCITPQDANASSTCIHPNTPRQFEPDCKQLTLHRPTGVDLLSSPLIKWVWPPGSNLYMCPAAFLLTCPHAHPCNQHATYTWRARTCARHARTPMRLHRPGALSEVVRFQGLGVGARFLNPEPQALNPAQRSTLNPAQARCPSLGRQVPGFGVRGLNL